jgi:ATP-dependent Lhr-like helicase
MADPLQRFSPPVRRWFTEAFAAPTPPQTQGWPPIAAGEHTLICAPTGSGKTLAAFLWCLDELIREGAPAPVGIHTLYISPLRALGYDIERNLRQPLRGICEAAREEGVEAPALRVAVRTGDTTPAQRAAMLRRPPHLLITTPESLFILLTSPRAAPLLATVRYVVVDEIHALLGNKRGVSLALSLERLVALAGGRDPVRIGLSATVRPLEQAARFLGGYRPGRRGALEPRPVTVVDAGRRKDLDLQVVAPVPDLGQLPGDSVWPEAHTLLLEWIRQHRSTLVFVRMRAQAERLARALNERADQELARAHHGSLSRPTRLELEEQLKAGRVPALVSTGTLELGIDVGAIDLVVQAGSPGAVATGLQRVGRAGHLLSERSRGRLLALYREDLVECAVVGQRMLRGAIEATAMPRNALDVLAQHVLSAVAMAPATGGDLLALYRRAAPYRELGREPFDTVLELLAGRYPAAVARGLTAKLVWERSTDRLSPRPGAARLVTTTGGTIPDRGYFPLQLADGTRLGELEEEFVFERREGDVIAFGAGSWRITRIDRQRVVVAPAPGARAVIPFWKGGLFGRDPELSEAIGAFRRELFERVEQPTEAERWLLEGYPLDRWAADNLVQYFAEQRRRGKPVGTDRQVVVELFADDLGDHNLLVHSTFGNRLNAPWAMALRNRLREQLGLDPQVISDDNGILLRLPAGEAPPPLDLLSTVDADRVEELVTDELAGSAAYGTLFRENAARFLVLGTYGTTRRTPLWLQRLRAKDLQEATAQLPDFPVRLETFRECLQQLMDLPRLVQLLEEIARGEVRVVTHQTDRPSPVASGLLNRFIGKYMYEYDEPRAERMVRRLQVDRDLLDQVLGRPDAHELLAIVLRLGLVGEDRLADHCVGDPAPMVADLLADGRLSRYSRDGQAWLCASEDLPLWVRAHGRVRVYPPREVELPESSPAALRVQLLLRVLDNLGPSSVDEVVGRTGFSEKQVRAAVRQLVRRGQLREGAFRAEADGQLVCTPLNLEQIRRRSLVWARRQVEPVEPEVLQRFVLEHHRLDRPATGREALPRALEQLALRPLPADLLERDLLPARLQGYQPGWLDELVASGELVWSGAGARRVWLCPAAARDLLALRVAAPGEEPPDPVDQALVTALTERGASFLVDLTAALSDRTVGEIQRGLWRLVWAGRVTNDRWASLRQGLQSGFEPPAAPPAVNPLTGRPSSFSRRRRPPVLRSAPGGPWAGRWALVPETSSNEVEGREVVALLLARYGIVARELVELEPAISWGSLYPVLCQLELAGELARGLFVRGLGAAQFAPSETVDRLRALRDVDDAPLLLNSWDPALVAGAIGVPLPVPLVRRPSTYAVLQGGGVVLVAEGARLHLDLRASTDAHRAALGQLRALLRRGLRAVRVEQVNDQPVLKSPLRPLLEELGYSRDGKALEIRRFG